MPEHFSFFLMNDNQPEFYRLKRRFINLGGDYTLYDQKGKLRVKEGDRMTLPEILSVDWLVKGIEGSPKG